LRLSLDYARDDRGANRRLLADLYVTIATSAPKNVL
jgi:hypothetical protein